MIQSFPISDLPSSRTRLPCSQPGVPRDRRHRGVETHHLVPKDRGTWKSLGIAAAEPDGIPPDRTRPTAGRPGRRWKR